MIIWLAMLIPLLGCAVAFYFFSKKFVWWELLVPVLASILTIVIVKFSTEASLLDDTQYMGGMIVEARYYEYWETWVDKTCHEQVACGSHTEGSGKDARTVTDYCDHAYDCSYCDDHSPYWMVYDDQGHSYQVDESEYKRLMKQWSATPVFLDQNRHIVKYGGCGKDGDAYSVRWDGKILTSETSTWTGCYQNHVQVAKANFGIGEVTKEQAKKYKLYEYPTVNFYSQRNILGMDSVSFLTANDKWNAYKNYDYFNGYYGPKRKMRLFILLFANTDPYVAQKQKDYWVNGNKNEVVICIGVDKASGAINWVVPFTWTENKRIEIDLREDISGLKKLDFNTLYPVIEKSTEGFKYRDFSKFDYLSVDSPRWEVWLVYILTFLVTGGLLYYGYQNEFENESM